MTLDQNVPDWTTANLDEYMKFKELVGETMVFNIHRSVIDPGRSFSAEALDAVMDGIRLWVGTRMMQMWESGGPPVSMDITITVENAVKATDEAHRKWREQ